MVGGKVIETIALPDRIWVNVIDWDVSQDQTTGIYLQRNRTSERVKPNDSIWWQSDSAYWTPKDRKEQGVKIGRIGPSGTMKPKIVEN